MRKLSEKKKKWIERTIANGRSYKAFLYNRFFIFLLSALLQLVVFTGLIISAVYNSAWTIVLQILNAVLSIVFVLSILNGYDRPSSKIGWILLILIFPAFGVPMYLFNGRGRPARKMRERVERAAKENEEQIRAFYGEREIPEPKNRNDAVTRYLAANTGNPVYYDGEVEYYKSGEEMFPQMLTALKGAEKFILLEYFIIAHGRMWKEILEILVEKACLGVKVRIIYDDFGCILTLPPRYEEYLSSLSENIRVLKFNDVVPFFAVRMNHRDHRKILVVDGKTAFTGGINLADEYIGEKQRFGHWKDTGVKVTGNAVQSFTNIFFRLWNAFSPHKEELQAFLLPYAFTENRAENTPLRIQPYDDSPLDNLSVGETVYVDIINRARDYVWIFTPYLVLDDYARAALCEAALRGVDVRIVTPGIPDKKLIYRLTRANYAILLKAGVKIYEYTPGFLHAKSIISDDECAVVGTINFDYRSLYHHFENALYFAGCDAVYKLKQDYEETFALSRTCSGEFPKRTLFGRLLDSVLRVLETLM